MSVFQWVKLGVNPQSYIMPILGGLTAIGIAPTAKEYFNSAKEYGSYAGRMACDLTNQATGYFSSGIPSIPCESFFPSESTKESANFNAENPSFETSEGASATFSDNLADATVKIVGAFTEGLAKGSTKVFMQTAETVKIGRAHV